MLKKEGFTLVEVIVALAVFLIILTLLMGSLSRSLKAREIGEKRASLSLKGFKILKALRRDLESAYVLDPKTNFLGEEGGAFGRVYDSLVFSTISGGIHKKVEWKVEPSYEKEEGTLVRHEDRMFEEDFSNGGLKFEITDGILEFNLRFFDGKEWSERWDSESGLTEKKLPLAVEVNLVLSDGKEEMKFYTLIPIRITQTPTLPLPPYPLTREEIGVKK